MAAVLLTASGLFTSCEKVSPTGVLIGNTSVDDRVKQSLVNFSSLEVAWDKDLADTIQEYSFLVGSDSSWAATATSPKTQADLKK